MVLKNNKNNIKIFITSNTAHCHRRSLDATRLIKYFKLNCCKIVSNPKDSTHIIVITCAFHQDTEDRAVILIEELSKYNKELIIVGCLPGVAPERIQQFSKAKFVPTQNLNEIDLIFNNFKIKFSELPDANFLAKSIAQPSDTLFHALLTVLKRLYSKCLYCLKYEFTKRLKKRKVQLLPNYMDRSYVCANIRVSEGCTGNCSYCIIRKAIGKLKSKPLETCLKEYRILLDQGKREFAITADNVGAYGIDINSTFAELLEEMSKIDNGLNAKWIILDLHPRWAIQYKSELIKLIKDGRIKHILCPVQSGSSRILGLMNRYTDIEQIKMTLSEFKKANPDFSITSHFIVGFPSETEQDFQATLNFVDEVKIDPIFLPYSDRKGTISYELQDKIDPEIIKNRMQKAGILQKPSR